MPSRASPSQVSGSTTGFNPKLIADRLTLAQMPIEIGRHALEGAGAVEHGRAKPGSVRAWSHDRHIAVMPFALEEGPGLRIADGFHDLDHANNPGGFKRSGFISHSRPNGYMLICPSFPRRIAFST